MSINLAHLQSWVGKTETATDHIGTTPIEAMAHTFNLDAPAIVAAPLRPLWHWLYFLPLSPLNQAGPDGHPARGGFLPPVPLPRRMWAGSNIDFISPIHAGDSVHRTSIVQSVEHKQGRTGDLIFVNVLHEIYKNKNELCISEKHNIVYRDAPESGSPQPTGKPAPTDATWSRTVHPSPVLLFRYSALTFNSHRIHYDRPYTTEVEGYPGLIVHGPMIATFLLDLLHEHLPEAVVTHYEFRAVSPLFDHQSFSIHGRYDETNKRVTLWAANQDGMLAMQAEATLA